MIKIFFNVSRQKSFRSEMLDDIFLIYIYMYILNRNSPFYIEMSNLEILFQYLFFLKNEI